MKVSALLASRQRYWHELSHLCRELQGSPAARRDPRRLIRLATLYRAACADLALADAYQLPPGTVQYLHQLVGSAHNQLYRSRALEIRRWYRELFIFLPQRLFHDWSLRLAFVIFWGVFVFSAALAWRSPDYAERALGKDTMTQLEGSFSEAPTQGGLHSGGLMTGVYTLNNPSIGLRCFAFGLLLGVGGLYETLRNAGILGAMFGFMGRTPQGDNFYHFVTAHAPFELTAVVLSAAAGMRLGFALVDTRGYTRVASLRMAARQAMPAAALAVVLFLLAAGIEAFISPSALPYGAKVATAIFSAGLLVIYFVLLGYPREGLSRAV